MTNVMNDELAAAAMNTVAYDVVHLFLISN